MNTLNNDRDTLLRALESATRTFRQKYPRRTIIGPKPDNSILETVAEAIGKCAAFKAVAGHVLYTGGSGPILTADWLAEKLFDKAEGLEPDITGATDWLLRVLSIREASGAFKAAIWGFSVSDETAFPGDARMMPFTALPDSFMKARISERAKALYDQSMWLSHNYFDTPRVAFVIDVPTFPYIGTDGSAFSQIARMEQDALAFWEFVAATSIGHPLAVGCWFEYNDPELDIQSWQNTIAWILPEIHPRVAACAPTTGKSIRDDLSNYESLPERLRSDLLRSMRRFILSQCRREMIDRILDLALAFEIAVSGSGEQAPPSWKVSVRSAQLIGGPLKTRQNNRASINELYKFRNRATHGSTLNDKDREKQERAVLGCSDLYQRLLRSFLLLNKEPDWNALELEPRNNAQTIS